MIVQSVINPLKEKRIFSIDLSIQFSGTTSEAMSSKIFLKVSIYVWVFKEHIFSIPNIYHLDPVLNWKAPFLQNNILSHIYEGYFGHLFHFPQKLAF